MRFPIDAQAMRRLSPAVIQEHRALPLMQDATHLFVAVDALSSVATLQSLRSIAGQTIVPVIAPRGRLSSALSVATKSGDVWAANVSTA